MTSIREALGAAVGLRGGRCRGHPPTPASDRPTAARFLPAGPGAGGDVGDPVWTTARRRKRGPRRASRQGQAECVSSARPEPRAPASRHLDGGRRPASPDVTAAWFAGVTPRYCPNPAVEPRPRCGTAWGRAAPPGAAGGVTAPLTHSPAPTSLRGLECPRTHRAVTRAPWEVGVRASRASIAGLGQLRPGLAVPAQLSGRRRGGALRPPQRGLRS